MLSSIPLTRLSHKDWGNRLCLLIRAKQVSWPFYFPFTRVRPMTTVFCMSPICKVTNTPGDSKERKNLKTFWQRAPNLESRDLCVL